MTPRPIFFISDGTGITAQALGRSLLSQFEPLSFHSELISYVDTIEKAERVVEKINLAGVEAGEKPLVFATLVDAAIQEKIAAADALFLDFFQAFIGPLETELKQKSSHRKGRAHGLIDHSSYQTRIEAVNYTLSCDDGLNTKHYDQADIILIGVSRSGKTPTCLYLALQFGLFVANFPLLEEDLNSEKLPASLQPYYSKLFGLTIDPARLHAIRTERRANSQYASLPQCQLEISQAEILFKKEKINFLNSTARSIEEIATTILTKANLKRKVSS